MRWIFLSGGIIIVALLIWPALITGWKGSKKAMTKVIGEDDGRQNRTHAKRDSEPSDDTR